MAAPILLIHGYSAESATIDLAGITSIYGTLPAVLRQVYGAAQVFELDVSRYITLDDGVTLDDIAFALERALRTDYAHLLQGKFRVIVHSTGALVIRNWIRRFGEQYPSRPLERVIYLAGALSGSGWAHIGSGQLAKWGRWILQAGAERGVRVLEGLELASEWTIDLHTFFLDTGHAMIENYGVREAAIIGSSVPARWFLIPIRYAKEDGSDGVVRVAAGNPNITYVQLALDAKLKTTLTWNDAEALDEQNRAPEHLGQRAQLYVVVRENLPGGSTSPQLPMAVALNCAHTGATGIVEHVTDQVRDLVTTALDRGDAEWDIVVDAFTAATQQTYDAAALRNTAPLGFDSRSQYDRHAQVVFRVRDQDGRPVTQFDIFFNNATTDEGHDPRVAIGDLFEDKHVNRLAPHCICLYLRLEKWNGTAWEDRLAQTNGCFLEISAVEPFSKTIRYLPLQLSLSAADLARWIRPNGTTIVDVELFRLPSPDVFVIKTAQ